MSLPREPRQKMINMMYLVLTALLALNVSSEILNAFKTVNNSLETTNGTVDKSTSTILASLQDKKTRPETAERAIIWAPKAEAARNYSVAVFSYIQTLKDRILREADGDPNNPDKTFKEDNLDIATRIMVDKGEGKKLKSTLETYKNDILAIDPNIKTEFANSLPINTNPPKGRSKATQTWEGAYFHMVPTVAALTILSKFQNDVRTTENKIVAYCHEQVGKVEVRFDTYAAIVGQSSNYLMPGQELEIKAGVGAFSKAALPVITVGGQTQAINDSGYVRYKTVVNNLGNGSVPVHIEYTDQNNKKQVIDTRVSYTVGQANASIALDKMNVLYIGVDNPITIAASGGGDDKVVASISAPGATLTKAGNGKWIARVSQQTDECRITVSVDGKTAGASLFRVRRIPSAVATIGGFASGENIPAGTFRAQGGVAAWIKDFPFDLKYTVTQFTISTDSDDGDIVEATVNGNAFDNKAAQLIRDNVKAGKTVYIDNIRAIGEDKENRKVPSLVYYIK